MVSKKTALLATVMITTLSASVPASALNIVLHADSSFTNSPNGAAALLGFRKAANYWNKTITTNQTLNFDVHFDALRDGVLGSTGSNGVDTSVRQTYRQLGAVGNSALDAIAVANLRGLTAAGGLGMRVPSVGPNGPTTTSGSVFDNNDSFNNLFLASNTSINKALGISYNTRDTYFAQSGMNGNADADITFSSNFAFDFNPTNGVNVGTYDFIGVCQRDRHLRLFRRTEWPRSGHFQQP
jgi:hypothetical protein